MPRYFFDVQNDGQSMLDDVGCDLTDDHEAERDAITMLQEMAKSLIIKDGHGGLRTSVRNAAGDVIFTATLSLAMERTVVAS